METTTDKKEAYALAVSQARALTDGIENHVGAMANVTALLKESFSHYFWVGFYIVRGDMLELGPFQGPVACYSIKKGKGVCGKAWENDSTIIVPDVDKFPGHIACSSLSRSEIVVPVHRDGKVVAVIDVDSAKTDAFDNTDKEGIEKIAEIVGKLF